MTPVRARDSLRMAVDLTPLPLPRDDARAALQLETLLHSLVGPGQKPFVMVYLTGKGGVAYARRLARPRDEIYCLGDGADAVDVGRRSESPLERPWRSPPHDLLRHLRAHLYYSPFGSMEWKCDGIPSVATLMDVASGCDEIQHSFETNRAKIRLDAAVASADLLHVRSEFTLGVYAREFSNARGKLVRARLLDFPCPTWAKRLRAAELVSPAFVVPCRDGIGSNHEVLLLAYRIYRHHAKERAWDLLLISREPRGGTQGEKLMQTLGIESGVRFTSFTSPEPIEVKMGAVALIDAALVDTDCATLDTAFALGLPLACSQIGARAEIGGDACLYFDPRKPAELAEVMLRFTTEQNLAPTLSDRMKVRKRALMEGADVQELGERIAALTETPEPCFECWTDPYPIREQIRKAARLLTHSSEPKERVKFCREMLALAVQRNDPMEIISGWLEAVAYAEASAMLAVAPENAAAPRQWQGLASAALLRYADRFNLRLPVGKLKELRTMLDSVGG